MLFRHTDCVVCYIQYIIYIDYPDLVLCHKLSVSELCVECFSVNVTGVSGASLENIKAQFHP